MWIRVASVLALLAAACGSAHAQSTGTLNLQGPSTTPGAPQITSVTQLNAPINAALAAKADALNGVLTTPTINSGTLSGAFGGSPTLSGLITLSRAGTALAITNNVTIGGTLSISDGATPSATTSAAQLAASYYLPINNPASTFAVGDAVSGTNVAASSVVQGIGAGTTPFSKTTGPIAVGTGVFVFPVLDSTSVSAGQIITSSGGGIVGASIIVMGVNGAASAPYTLLSPTNTTGSAPGGLTIAVSSGGTSCPLGSLVLNITNPTSLTYPTYAAQSTATTVYLSQNTAANILNTDVVRCYPAIYYDGDAGRSTVSFISGDTVTFSPSILLNKQTSGIVASGATITAAASVSSVASDVVRTGGVVNAGISGLQINGQTVVQTRGGLAYQNFPGDVTLVGIGAGANMSEGESLATAVGYQALGSYIGGGSQSTVIGYNVANHLIQGTSNNLFGINALGTCVYSCSSIVAMGTDAFRNSTSVTNSIGIGSGAQLNHNGSGNIAIGAAVLQGIVGGSALGQFNTVVGAGSFASTSLTTAATNAAVGSAIATTCTTCSDNAVLGYNAGGALTVDSQTVLIGKQAGYRMSGTNGNTCVGNLSCSAAAMTGNGVTALGANAGRNVTGGSNTLLGNAVGNGTLTTGTFNILIGTRTGITNASGSDTPAAATVLYLNIGNTIINDMHTPSITSGAGTSPTASTQISNSAWQFITGTTAGSAIVLGFPNAAPTGWACTAVDVTTPVNRLVVVPTSTTSVTVNNYSTTNVLTAFGNAETIQVRCAGY